MNDPKIEKIHKDFTDFGGKAKEWLRQCQMLLPMVAKYEVWKVKGFGSIYEYSAKLAGMSKSSVDNALWTLRKIEGKPALMKLAKTKGVCAVRPVANVATTEDQEFWAEKAESMSVRALETYVRESKSLHVAKAQPDELDVNLTLKSDLAKRLEQMRKHVDFEAHFEKHFEQLLNKLEEELEGDKPCPVKSGKRYIPAKIRQYVLSRTNGLCAFPCCKKPYKILHHTKRWALEKTHDPDCLVPLCVGHERLMHLGLIENEKSPPSEWLVRKQPDHASADFWVDQMLALYR